MSEVARHEIKRSTEFWYQDGNIVLQCENTQFRVHQSLLTKHFPIHADASAFALSDESEYVEGCPVARVFGDRPEDWENVLMAVYNPFTTYSSTTEYPMPVVLSTLRLAHKYQSDHLRDMALTCLKTKMPMDLADISVLLNMSRRVAPPFIDYIFEILDTALDLGMQSIIPLACLLCIRFIKLDQIFDNYTHSNGSITSLSPEACKLILKGWQSLTVAAIDSTLHDDPMKYPISEHCPKHFLVDISPEDSEVYDCGVEGRASQQRLRVARVADNPANVFVLGSVQLCHFCVPLTSIDVDYFRDRDELWDRLPSFFGLPPWNQLKDFYP